MKLHEVEQVVALARTYRPTILADPATAKAWYLALDVRMTQADAVQCLAALAGTDKLITPGAINNEFLSRRRPADQQGQPRPMLPGQEQSPRPVPQHIQALTTAPAVPPTEVPEYVKLRKDAITLTEAQRRIYAIPCPYCEAPKGKPCHRKGHPDQLLQHRIAHPGREEAASDRQ